MKIMVISHQNRAVCDFRGDLIREFIKCGNEVVVTGPNKERIEDVKKLGVSFQEVPVQNNKVGIKADIEYYKNIKRVIKEEKPDKIFSYTIKPVVYGTIAASRCGVKEVYSMIPGLGRVYTGDRLKTKILRIITGVLYKYSLKYCKKVFFQNIDDMELFLKKKYLKREQCVKVDGSGVNLERFTQGEFECNKTFLMMSRMFVEKGVFEYCDAAKIVKAKHPDAKFILLGGYDDSLTKEQVDLLKEYNKNGLVEIPGEIKDVLPVIQNCFSFVLPTYYREGIPRSILEAMACGKPIITTDWVGTREAVEDGRNGYLVPIKNAEALAEKMIELIEDPDMAKEMGEESYKICKEKFDVNIINEKILNAMDIEGAKVDELF